MMSFQDGYEEEGSVTRWVGKLQRGEDTDEATRTLWQRYFRDLVRLARARLRDAPRSHADEEDAALNAFDSFCRGVASGRFPELGNRDELWRLLVTLTVREVADQVQRERRLKRGGGRVVGEAPPKNPDLKIDEVEAPSSDGGSSPEQAAIAAENYRRLFGALSRETLRVVALLKLEGYTNEQIAASLGCGLRTVERRLEEIRTAWRRELTP
jgi:DNA-directed RNA polymerase specialized sigma24 family protein